MASCLNIRQHMAYVHLVRFALVQPASLVPQGFTSAYFLGSPKALCRKGLQLGAHCTKAKPAKSLVAQGFWRNVHQAPSKRKLCWQFTAIFLTLKLIILSALGAATAKAAPLQGCQVHLALVQMVQALGALSTGENNA